MADYGGIADVLRIHGFKEIHMQGEGEPSQVLFIKERSGVAIPVTIPVECSHLPDAAIKRIMQTAQISEPEYLHLLKNP